MKDSKTNPDRGMFYLLLLTNVIGILLYIPFKNALLYTWAVNFALVCIQLFMYYMEEKVEPLIKHHKLANKLNEKRLKNG